MPNDLDASENPLAERYASRAMRRIFSPRFRFTTWRRLWLALARAEAELGLPITPDQLGELERTVEDIDFERARELERELRHDVMAHVNTWREQCPGAGRILHLGATSCFVTDNSELIQMRAGLDLLLQKVRAAMRGLRDFALEHRSRPCVGWTHFQPAQFTTVGKRACLWLQDLLLDHREIERVRSELRFRGVKGTTGTQDSFMKLFAGDEEKVRALDERVAARMGFDRVFEITGQTYTRKQDAFVLGALAGLAQTGGKFSSDLRLLCHLREVEEPWGTHQIGSSAMAYKRNPMRSERMAALSRWLLTISQNGGLTASTQWMERTLDDSANRRLAVSQSFLAADAILELMANLAAGLVVREAVIARRVDEHLPFIASEEILMEAVKHGGDRQALHEIIRVAANEASERMKTEGAENDFLDRLARHPDLGRVVSALRPRIQAERYTGRAASQVERFVAEEVDPVLGAYDDEDLRDEVRV